MAVERRNGGREAQIQHLSDGGISGAHPQPADFTVLVAPATASERNTVISPVIPIACWSVGDIRFEFDSSFVKPEAAQEMRQLMAIREAHKKESSPGVGSPTPIYPPLSIFGHADPTGNDEYNKKLSGRRATAIYGLVTRDTELWEHLYSNPSGGDQWGLRSTQTILGALGFLAGPATGTRDEATREAVLAFQRANGLAQDGDPGPATRQKLYVQYMDKLCGPDFKLDKRKDFLGRGEDSGGKADYQGCSEFNPVLMFSQAENEQLSRAGRQGERNAQNAPNRRVVVFLFRPGARVMASRWPCPRASEGVGRCRDRFWSDAAARRTFQAARRVYETSRDTFACRFYDLMADRSPCERAVAVLRVRLHDCFGRKMPNVRYRLEYAGRQKGGQADAEGFASDTLDPAAERCTVRWDPVDPQASDPQEFVYELDVFVQGLELETEEGVRRRLHNLGYLIEDDPRRNLLAFQSHHELEPTGQVDEETKTKLQDIYGDALDDSAAAETADPASAPDAEQRT